MHSRQLGKGRWLRLRRVVAGGRKPAQPSIPEGILGFPPPDPQMDCTLESKLNALIVKGFRNALRVKTPIPQQKFRVQ